MSEFNKEQYDELVKGMSDMAVKESIKLVDSLKTDANFGVYFATAAEILLSSLVELSAESTGHKSMIPLATAFLCGVAFCGRKGEQARSILDNEDFLVGTLFTDSIEKTFTRLSGYCDALSLIKEVGESSAREDKINDDPYAEFSPLTTED